MASAVIMRPAATGRERGFTKRMGYLNSACFHRENLSTSTCHSDHRSQHAERCDTTCHLDYRSRDAESYYSIVDMLVRLLRVAILSKEISRWLSSSGVDHCIRIDRPKDVAVSRQYSRSFLAFVPSGESLYELRLCQVKGAHYAWSCVWAP